MNKAYLGLLFITMLGCSQQSSDEYVASAKQHIAADDLSSATIELKNAIKADPKLSEARFLLGKVYLQLAQYENAEKEFNRALDNGYSASEVIPLLSRAYQRTGADVALTKLAHQHAGLTADQAAEIAFYKLQAYMRLENTEKAKKLIEEMAAIDSQSPFKKLAVVYDLLIRKNNDAALVQIDSVLSDVPAQREALKLKALLLLQANDRTAATQVYEIYYQSYPEDHEVAFILAKLFTDLNKTDQAEPIVDQLLLINAEHSLLNQLKGVARFNDKDYSQALNYSEKAIIANPSDPALRLIAGYSAYFNKNYQSANQHLSVIATNLPAEHPGLRVLAASQLALGEFIESSETLKQFDNITQKEASLLSSVGLALAQAGEIEKAKQIVVQSKQVSKSADELARLGLLQLSVNDLSGILNLEQAVEIAPEQSLKKTLATAYLSTEKYDKAIELANKWKLEQQVDVQAYLLAGTAYMKLNQYAEAKEEFTQALALEGENLQAKIALIELEDRLGNKVAAKQGLDILLNEKPNFIPALIKKYLFAKQAGDVQVGLSMVEQAFSNEPDNMGLRLLLAKIRLNDGDFKQAITLLESLNEDAEKPPSYWDILGEAYWRSGDFQRAEKHFEQWLTAYPTSRSAIFGRLILLDGKREFAQGLKTTTQHLEKDQTDMQMQLLHTHFLIMTEDIDNARLSYEKLSSEVRQLPFARGLKGQLQAIDEDYVSALVNLTAAYNASPNARNVRLIYLCYLKTNQIEQGYQFLVTHFQQHQQDIASLMLMANVEIARDVDTAIASYEKALELHADNFIALNNLAYFYLQKESLNKAENFAEKALAIQPRNADVLDTLAQVLIAKKQYETALQHLTIAIEDKNVKEEIYVNYIEALLLNDEKALAQRKIAQRNLLKKSSQEKLAQLQKSYHLTE
ncbi:XrtA/PEP-CTERM system TPR-repeat protein PrsT [Colwelliaceae bacterium 6471]